ncbi:MAG: amidohydrolase [Proteobacteria bacterium]|nr:amidohydrolase [Pseudomonadota bacterium]
MFRAKIVVAIFFVGLGSALANASEQPLQQTIYYGGNIITMEGEDVAYVDAVVERDGKIIYAGDKSGAVTNFAGKTREVDLKGKAMMPGFIEPHLHPSIAAILLSGDIVAPHDWHVPEGLKKGVEGHDAYIARLKESIAKNGSKDDVLFIWGYHQLWHGDLSREILNEISPDIPVGIIHRSFHEIFVNDKAIAMFGIKEKEFKGNPQVDWDRGHFYEGGWLALVPKIAPRMINPERYKRGLVDMTKIIRKNGITTIAEQGFPTSNFDMEYQLLKSEMDKNPPYEVYNVLNGTQLYGMRGSNEKAWEFMEAAPEKYNTDNILMLPKQVKLYADGAIYSLAMEMKEGYSDGFKGQWMTPPVLFEKQMNFYWDKGYKINIHANGDLGIQLCLDITEKMMKRKPRKNHRLTLHHLGYFTDDQAEQMQALGIEASANPYYLWALADKYSEYGLGPERARNLVDMKSLKDRDIPFSFHSDFGMAPLEPLTLAWTAINRITAEQTLVSQNQRIDVFTAMQAITINAARTLDLENTIGSITVGKTANFTLLDENPFKVEPMHIKDISVAGVVYRGRLDLN